MGSGSRDEGNDTRALRPSRPSLASGARGRREPAEPTPDFGPRYKVLAKLGSGGMGEVYRAYDADLRGEVALKVIREGGHDHDAALARFRREVALARKVTSSNVLRVYDLDEHDGIHFLSMELVEGDDLATMMARGRLPLDTALAIFRQVCAGISVAHDQSVVHRDLKPSNVMVDRDGRVKVADFGLARALGDDGLTVTGTVIGSPAYMSPEQVRGEPADARSDIYALGILLYQLLAGETPFRAENHHAMMQMRLHQPPTPLRELAPDVPPSLEPVVMRCLAIAPADRYPNVYALLAALDTRLAPPRSRGRWWLAAALGVGAIAGIAYVATRPAEPVAAASHATPAPPLPTPDDQAIVLITSDNRTGDPTFDGTLDLVVGIDLRGSPLLDTYAGGYVQALVGEVAPGSAIDAAFGRAVSAARDRRRTLIVNVVATTAGAGFSLAITATDTADGRLVLKDTAAAASVHDVVRVTVRLAREVRRALGEALPADPASAPVTEMSPDLEVMHECAVAGALLTAQDDTASATHYARAIALDPSSPEAHIGMAIALYNGGRYIEANEQNRAALALSDRLNVHDRLKFLGDYHSNSTGEYDQAILDYNELLRRWPHEVPTAANLANSYLNTHHFAKALEIARRVGAEHPRNLVVRENIANYEVVAGDLDAAQRDLEAMRRDFPHVGATGWWYSAIIAAEQGHPDQLAAALAGLDHADPSRAAYARADLALSRGRVAEAIGLLDRGVTADVAAHDDDGVEAKHMLLAGAYARQGNRAAALAAATTVRTELTRQFYAAMVQLALGERTTALATADRLSRESPPLPRALAHVLIGEAARLARKPADAIRELDAALALDDGWYAHFLRGRALFDAARYPEAKAELVQCQQRRGEGTIVFLDDYGSLRLLPPMVYWLARTLDALGDPAAREQYAAFIASQATGDRDPMVDDAKQRLAGLTAHHG